MTFIQIILAALFLLIVYSMVRRYLNTRGLNNYEPKEVKERLKDSLHVILLDVRTAAERKRQSIKGSFHIPLHELESRSNELKKFKDKEIICYCQTGSRSVVAAGKLKKLGFNSANMKGGITRWNLV